MITRASKYFIGAAVAAYLAALIYGFITGASAHGGIGAVFQEGDIVDSVVGPISFGWKGWVGEHIGYSVLMTFAGTMAVMAGFTSVFRDGSAEPLAELQGATIDRTEVEMPEGRTLDLRVAVPKGLNIWPFIGAFAAGAIIIGLALSPTLFVIGCIILVVVAVEWAVRTWAFQAVADPAEAAALRNRFMAPVELPIGTALVLALIVFLMSRVLLAVPSIAAVLIIILTASIIFGVSVLMAYTPRLKRSVLVGALIIFGVALLAGGIAGGVAGARDIETHEESSGVVLDDPSATTGTTGY